MRFKMYKNVQRFFNTSTYVSNFVPKCSPVKESDIIALIDFINQAKTLVILTGAGLSTESGIPDYRSEGVGLYARTDRRPVDYSNFIKNENAHRRYWARNFVAWPQFSSFQPNVGHRILADWEKTNKLHYLITQNVDRLHMKAGSSRVVELHGTTHKVFCLKCGDSRSRHDLQDELSATNRDWLEAIDVGNAVAPDGDIQLSDEAIDGFQVPKCRKCGGMMKPEVVFFGENVPQVTVQKVDSLIGECDSLLAIGSSLFVYSGYRIVLKCREEGKRFAVLNIGPTRADHLAELKVEARCGDVLLRLAGSDAR